MREATVDVGLHPHAIVSCQRVVGCPGEQRLQCHAELEPRQAPPEAEVKTEAKGEVVIGRSSEIEAIRLREDSLVAVGRTQQNVNALARIDPLAVQLDFAKQRARDPLHGGIEPQQLFDRRRPEAGVASQSLTFDGELVQRDDDPDYDGVYDVRSFFVNGKLLRKEVRGEIPSSEEEAPVLERTPGT